jgi:hypothetical protein
VALPEVSDPPELIGPLAGVAKPAGKSDSGSSTDSSCVPVSCPDAAGRAVIDAVGSADAVAGAADADAVADGDGVTADAGEVADGGEELLDEEQPASATSAPVLAASAASTGRTPRTATDDIAQPTVPVH